MNRPSTLNRSLEGSRPAHNESFWRRPRAASRLVDLAAEAREGIAQGLSVADCFELNRQYWLQLHQHLTDSSADRFKDKNYQRLFSVDQHIVDQLDQSKLNFFVNMASCWRLDQAPPPAKTRHPLEGGEPRLSREKPWARPLPSEVGSRRQHRANHAIRIDYSHLWANWLVVSDQIDPLQVGQGNYRSRIAELQEAVTETKDLADSIREAGRSVGLGPDQTPIERQLNLLGRTLAHAEGVYDQANRS